MEQLMNIVVFILYENLSLQITFWNLSLLHNKVFIIISSRFTSE